MKKLVNTMGIITLAVLAIMLCSGMIYRGTESLKGRIIGVADTATTNIQTTQEVETTQVETVQVETKEEYTMVNAIMKQKDEYIVLFENGTYFKGSVEDAADCITAKTGSLTVYDGKRLYSVIGGTLFEYDITKIW